MVKYLGTGRRAIDESELVDLLSVATDMGRCAYLLAADSGLRRAEITAVRTEDVGNGRIRVRMGKGGVSRWSVLTARAEAAVAGCRWCDRPLNYSWLGTMLRRDCRRAGIGKGVCLHSLRHRFATRLLQSGVSIIDIQLLLGHASVATTAIYLHSDEGRFDRAREALSTARVPSNLAFEGKGW